jgi:hypothetical protein
VLIGVRTIRETHERRTKFRYYLRVLAVLWNAIPRPGTWRDLEIAHLVGHSNSRTNEVVHRHELRPVIRSGAEIMKRIFHA